MTLKTCEDCGGLSHLTFSRTDESEAAVKAKPCTCPHTIPCPCPDWQKNMPKLNGQISMGLVHGAGYDGKVFQYCPWCGVMMKKEARDESVRKTR